MATRKMGLIEKQAINFGHLFRYQKSQFPRRWDLFVKSAKRELAPPFPKDWPAIKKDFATVVRSIENKDYRNYTVREMLVYGAIGLEVVWWFFVGEIIGRWNIRGYVVDGSYVDKVHKKKAAANPPDDPTKLK
ncbi:mitochondrial ATP synthase g subunit domain-containing protein [Ditylenchus destructor]|nr:mitochondrial ATP synthase g subunit domain-containing protein [Ditylenchus destructor]